MTTVDKQSVIFIFLLFLQYNVESYNFGADVWCKVFAWKVFVNKTAEYDSGFFTMNAQAGTNSYRELVHSFGAIPRMSACCINTLLPSQALSY